ncbi:OmpA family protein [uncultured Metabacillus sp.]|nr:OmpA family protein [uncultured Metabacillus sp.]
MKWYAIGLLAVVLVSSGCGKKDDTATSVIESENETLKKLEQGEPVMKGQVVDPGSSIKLTMKHDITLDLSGTKVLKQENAMIIRMLDEVLFNYDQAEFYEKAEASLRELDHVFAALPSNTTIIIEAHLDDRADNEFNLQLTKKRANRLLHRFNENEKLSHLSFSAVGAGEDKPIVPNDGNAENHQLNRRIDFVIKFSL